MEEEKLYHYKAKVVKIVDGDTIDIQIQLGFHITVEKRVRLFGVNTPETYGVKKTSEEYQAGMKAKEFVEHFLAGKECLVRTYLDKHGESKHGKYGRLLAEIFVSDISLNEKLLSEGLAVVAKY